MEQLRDILALEPSDPRFYVVLLLSLGIGLLIARAIKPYQDQFFRWLNRRSSRLSPEEERVFEQQHGEQQRMFDALLSGRPGSAPLALWKPLLYLQGFAREGEGRVSWSHEGVQFPLRLQTFLSWATLRRGGPAIVGIGGRASEVIKLKRQDEEWKQSFHQLAEWVNVIVIRPFCTPGVLYELNYLLANFPAKLILLMEPIDSDFDGQVTELEAKEARFSHEGEELDAEAVWNRVHDSTREVLELPAYHPTGGLVALEVDEDGSWRARREDFEPPVLAGLVERRGGFISRFAELVVTYPALGAVGARCHLVSVPAYSDQTTAAELERAFHKIVADEQNAKEIWEQIPEEGRPPLDEIQQVTARVTVDFRRWVTLEEAAVGNEKAPQQKDDVR